MEEERETEAAACEFYTDAAKYWEKIPATVDGMLGGFGFISNTDIEGSEIFLKTLFKLTQPPQKTYALDCGSGIGRITRNLLSKYFKRVDLVEQNSKFLEAARTYLESCSTKIGEYYPQGLQEFSPEAKKYDIIWSQWVLGHLQNEDLLNFFIKCRKGLRDNGVIIVKENVTSSNKVEIDTEDSSMTRPLQELQQVFKKAGLICIKEQRQTRFPRGLYPVYMFALRPVKIIAPTAPVKSIDTR